MGYVTKCSWNSFLRWHLDNRRYLCQAWLIIRCSKGICLTFIEATVVEILATSDAGALLGGFDKLNIIVISKSWIRQSQDEWTRHTYPEQTLSLGLPTPSAPPLESYCPPISSLFNLSTVSGRMHPVTESTQQLSIACNGYIPWGLTLGVFPAFGSACPSVFRLAPEIVWKEPLGIVVPARSGTIRLHTPWVLAIADVCMRVSVW